MTSYRCLYFNFNAAEEQDRAGIMGERVACCVLLFRTGFYCLLHPLSMTSKSKSTVSMLMSKIVGVYVDVYVDVYVGVGNLARAPAFMP